MTSLCTAFGAVPLILASGAGAESRRTLGATVFFGVTISVFLTLYLIPALYVLIARKTRSPEYIGRLIDKLKRDVARGGDGETVGAASAATRGLRVAAEAAPTG